MIRVKGAEQMAMPRHPHPDDDPAPAKKAPSFKTKLVVAVIFALLIAFIVLHVAGVSGP
jgi:hypothetical protein